jgi:hypothetical protein
MPKSLLIAIVAIALTYFANTQLHFVYFQEDIYNAYNIGWHEGFKRSAEYGVFGSSYDPNDYLNKYYKVDRNKYFEKINN